MDFMDLTAQCAPFVHHQTLHALVKVESGFNPYAIGVVRGRLQRQPRNAAEAVATAKELEKLGYNYSVGLAQVNKHNFRKYGLSIETAFDPCQSLRAGAQILLGCFQSARSRFPSEQHALRGAFSCYYSGNFSTGFRPDFKGQPSYVDKVVGAAQQLPNVKKGAAPIQVVRVAAPQTVRPTMRITSQPPQATAASEDDAPALQAPQYKSAMVF